MFFHKTNKITKSLQFFFSGMVFYGNLNFKSILTFRRQFIVYEKKSTA
jgi:hypothetical protein